MTDNIKLDSIEKLNHIAEVIADFYKMEVHELFLNTRRREIAYKRQMFFHFAERYFQFQLNHTTIGYFPIQHGGRVFDRNTVRHAIKTVQDTIEYDKILRNEYNIIDYRIKVALKLCKPASQEVLDKITQLYHNTNLNSKDLAKAFDINEVEVINQIKKVNGKEIHRHEQV